MTLPTTSDLSLHLHQAHNITRRYLVTNGFDGALTMLGLMVGFQTAGERIELPVAITACLGAAVALLMSGLSSAYLSETAERQKELQELEGALLADLKESQIGEASRSIPIVVALVNGLSPFLISLVIMTPLWLAEYGVVSFAVSPFLIAILIALVIIFLLGIFLGRISKKFWLTTALHTLFIALVTVGIIISLHALL